MSVAQDARDMSAAKRPDTHYMKLNQVKIVELKLALKELGAGFRSGASKRSLFDQLRAAELSRSFPTDVRRRQAEHAAARIQACWRGGRTRRLIADRGPGVVCRHLCNNLQDAVTQELIDEQSLPHAMFVSVRESASGKLFGFDIRSLSEMFNNDQKFNPFTRLPFTPQFVASVQLLYNRLRATGRPGGPGKKQTVEDRAFQLFHDIYLVSGHTLEAAWFTQMCLRTLKSLYLSMHHLLFVRYGVQAQNGDGVFYDPANPPFHRVSDMENANRWKAQDMLLEELKYIVTYPARAEDKQTVILWLIAAFRTVSLQAYYGMRHLD
jgi:hypothetical protein